MAASTISHPDVIPNTSLAPTTHPDITLINLGTNDIGGDFTDWQTRYGTLIDTIRQGAPGSAITCALIPYYRSIPHDKIDAANTAITAAVNTRHNTGPITTTDMTPITTHWTSDGMHPLDAAYLTMAQQWLTSIYPWL